MKPGQKWRIPWSFADDERWFELQVPFLEKLCRVLSKANAER
jgi:hypothetical protein